MASRLHFGRGKHGLLVSGLVALLVACATHPPAPAGPVTPTYLPILPVTAVPPRTFTPLATLKGHPQKIWSVAFHPTKPLLASGDEGGNVYLWDTTDASTAAPLTTLVHASESWVTKVVFSPNGQLLASAGDNKAINVWDVADPAAPAPILPPLTGHRRSVYALAFNARNTLLASGGADDKVILWDMTEPLAPRQLANPLPGAAGHIDDLAFSPTQDILAAATCAVAQHSEYADYDCQTGAVLLWDTTDPTAPKSLGSLPVFVDDVYSLAFSPNGQVLAASGCDEREQLECYQSSIWLWDMSDPQTPRPLSTPLQGPPSKIFGLAFSPDGQTLVAGGCNHKENSKCKAGEIRWWDLHDLRSPQPLNQPVVAHTTWIASLAFSADGRTLATGSFDTTIQLWAVAP